jgi:hypothetical protein
MDGRYSMALVINAGRYSILVLNGLYSLDDRWYPDQMMLLDYDGTQCC